MAHGWVKSLQCKSRPIEDVHDPNPRRRPGASQPGSSSCRSGSQALKDVVGTARQKHRPKPKPVPEPPPSARSSKPKKPPKAEPVLPVRAPAGLLYPALTELPDDHPSRKVVEIIFLSGWGPKPFSGRVEVVFKVQNGPRAAARFEEYREAVKSCALLRSGGAWEEDARCIADGNEVMRFQCLGPTRLGGGANNDFLGAWGSLQRGKKAAICTFSGSGGAHESAGGGNGRRAMLVCRVVAGRVAGRAYTDPFQESRVGFDSVSGENGALLLYDSRAVLPCFLIIYRL